MSGTKGGYMVIKGAENRQSSDLNPLAVTYIVLFLPRIQTSRNERSS